MSVLVPIKKLVQPCKTWNPVNHPDEQFHYIDISSVDRDLKKIISTNIIYGKDAPSRARQIANSNDVLVSTVRPNLNAVAKIPENLDGATVSTGFTVLRTTEFLDSGYLFHWVKTDFFIQDMIKKSTGANYPAVSDRIILDSLILLPNIEEQRRIAAILDKAEALRAKRREAIDKLDQLLQSVFLEMFGDPIQNNKGWDTTSLQSIGIWQSGGTPERSNPLYFQGKIPWFSSGELNELYAFDSKEHITHEAIEKSSAKIITPGSIMLGMYDTAAFKSSITTRECSCNQAIAFSKIDESKADSLYVYYVLQLGKDFYVSQQRGVRQKNLNLTIIKETRIPKPSLILQNKFSRIAKKIHEKKKTIEDQELKIDFFIKSLEHKFFQ